MYLECTCSGRFEWIDGICRAENIGNCAFASALPVQILSSAPILIGGDPCTPSGSLHSLTLRLLAPFRSLLLVGGDPLGAPLRNQTIRRSESRPPGGLMASLSDRYELPLTRSDKAAS